MYSRARGGGGRVSLHLVGGEEDREGVSGVADKDNLGVGRLRQTLRGLDALPLQELLRDALRHDALEVCDAAGFDGLALRLLALLREHKRHARALLLRLRLQLDRARQLLRQLQRLQQHVLHHDPARREPPGQLLLHLLLQRIAPFAVQRLRLHLARQPAHRRRQLRLHHQLVVVLAEVDVDVVGLAWIDVEENADVQGDRQAFLGRDFVLLVQKDCLGGECVDAADGRREVHAGLQCAAPHFAGSCHYADVGRGHGAEGGQEEHDDDEDNSEDRSPHVALGNVGKAHGAVGR
mmetsp:Transcript_28586/g.68171  ORF Transcript_28586/g.68171 Transcript_28586/m.68171 type:complete len:293 (-) Transcript_28586:94-972(-)